MDSSVIFRIRSNMWSLTNGVCFVEIDSLGLYGDFLYQIDTINHPPIFWGKNRYPPHEYEVMQKLMVWMGKNVVVEEYDGPCGAQVVLAAKTPQ